MSSNLTVTITGVEDTDDVAHALRAVQGDVDAGQESGAGCFTTLSWTWTAGSDEEHPEHEECADGCGLAVDHDGACREKRGGPELCSHDEDGDLGDDDGVLSAHADGWALVVYGQDNGVPEDVEDYLRGARTGLEYAAAGGDEEAVRVLAELAALAEGADAVAFVRARFHEARPCDCPESDHVDADGEPGGSCCKDCGVRVTDAGDGSWEHAED